VSGARALLVLLVLAPAGLGRGEPAAPLVEPARGFVAAADEELQPVRIPFVLNSGKIYVRVHIGAAHEAWFILDAGSPGLVLDTSVVEALGLATGPAEALRGAGEEPFSTRRVQEPVEVGLGPIEIRDRDAQSGPLDAVLSPFEGRRVEGILGVRNVFERFVVEIDYGAETLTLHDPDRFRYAGEGTVLAMEVRGARLLVRGTVAPRVGDPVAGLFLIDTGFRGALLLQAPFVERHDLLARTERTFRITTGAGIGGRVVPEVGLLRYVELAPVRVDDVPAWFSRSTTDVTAMDDWSGTIGSTFLQRFRVFVDRPGERLILERADVDERRVGFDRSGLFLVAAEGGRGPYRVLDLLAGSPAAAAGIELGDAISSVDGRAVSLEDLRRALRGPAGTTLTLRVVRNDVGRDVRVVLRSLFDPS